MYDLQRLAETATGAALLCQSGVLFDRQEFLDRVAADGRPVQSHQQIYLDLRGSVLAKLLALRDAASVADTEFIWIDTDRAGSDKLALRLYWDRVAGPHSIRFAPAGCERAETRDVALDADRVEAAMAALRREVRSTFGNDADVQRRFETLENVIGGHTRLASLGRAMIDHLLQAVIGWSPESELTSVRVGTSAVRERMRQMLSDRTVLIAVWNGQVELLRGHGVDPRVSSLAPDHLPLFVREGDGTRLRLRHRMSGSVHLAVAVDRRGVERSVYSLGRDGTDFDELDEVGGWSPDVSLPMLLNGCCSGVIAGRSSVRYLMVLGKAIAAIFGEEPVPVFMPRNLDPFRSHRETPCPDSLIHAYFRGAKL